MPEYSAFTAAFMLGLMGSGHCLGMCGGLISALGLSQQNASSKLSYLLAYNAGRILSYMLAGLIVGFFGFWLTKTLGASDVLRYLAGVMLILLGLYLGQWYHGLTLVEKTGRHLWKHIQPLAKKVLPIRSIPSALSVGLVWGWLPCGLVYSSLIYASSTGNAMNAALVMFCFGLGTLPSMMATGYFSSQLSRILSNKGFRSVIGLMMIAFGLWSLPPVQRLAFHIT